MREASGAAFGNPVPVPGNRIGKEGTDVTPEGIINFLSFVVTQDPISNEGIAVRSETVLNNRDIPGMIHPIKDVTTGMYIEVSSLFGRIPSLRKEGILVAREVHKDV